MYDSFTLKMPLATAYVAGCSVRGVRCEHSAVDTGVPGTRRCDHRLADIKPVIFQLQRSFTHVIQQRAVTTPHVEDGRRHDGLRLRHELQQAAESKFLRLGRVPVDPAWRRSEPFDPISVVPVRPFAESSAKTPWSARS